MTSSPGAFLSIRAGGPFDGVVSISTIQDEPRTLSVEATWTVTSGMRSVTVLVDGYDGARLLAHTWADLLADGQEPTGA